jgi:MYXO-CTERM domain-containing protein
MVEQFQLLPSGDLYGVGDGVFVRSPDGADWTSVAVDGPSDRVTPQGLFMLNPDCGWLVGGHYADENDAATDAGAVWYTSDGGDTWTVIAQDLPYALRRVHFVAGNLGWAVGSDGTRGIIVRTDDGGATWTELTVPDHPARPDVCLMSQCLTDPMPVTSMEQVRFWDVTRGIALGLSCTGGCGVGEDPTYVSNFLRTYDGGATWELDEDYEAAMPEVTIGPMTMPGLMSGMFSAGFYDPNKGFLGGQHTMILRYDADFLEDAAQSGMPGCESTAGDGGIAPHGDGGSGGDGGGPNDDPDGALYGCGCAGSGAPDAGLPLVLLLGLGLAIRQRRR